jgi:hypothetical protein
MIIANNTQAGMIGIGFRATILAHAPNMLDSRESTADATVLSGPFPILTAGVQREARFCGTDLGCTTPLA